MANFQNESRRRPTSDRYGTPGTQYPTANPYDVVITEEVPINADLYEPLVYGTPHHKRTDALLCFQGPIKGNSTDKNVLRIYANPRQAQETYNLLNGDDDANDPAYRIFVRSYLLPRGYTRGVMDTALTALIGLTVLAGGTGYTSAATSGKLPLSFSGGGGSGAAGYAEIFRGSVAAVVLTNTGTGYSSAPTVSISGGGTGASITALLQPNTAVLMDEVEQPAEEPFSGYFVRVTRTWGALPGRALTSVEMNGAANGALASTSVQVLATAAANYSPTWRTLAYSDLAIDANRKRRTVVTLDDEAFPTLTEYDQDPVLQYSIVTTFQIVDAAAVTAPTVSNGIIKSFKRMDKWRSIKVVEDHTALLLVEYSEQRFDAASFPKLFDYTQYVVSDVCGTFSKARDGFSTMVQSRTDTYFTATKQTIVGLSIIPNSIHLGKGIQETNILNDAGELTYTGDCTATIEFGASDPSRTAYLALVGSGTPQLITGESALYRAGIYRNTELYRTLL